MSSNGWHLVLVVKGLLILQWMVLGAVGLSDWSGCWSLVWRGKFRCLFAAGPAWRGR